MHASSQYALGGVGIPKLKIDLVPRFLGSLFSNKSVVNCKFLNFDFVPLEPQLSQKIIPWTTNLPLYETTTNQRTVQSYLTSSTSESGWGMKISEENLGCKEMKKLKVVKRITNYSSDIPGYIIK